MLGTAIPVVLGHQRAKGSISNCALTYEWVDYRIRIAEVSY
jgi:hypothetical protein